MKQTSTTTFAYTIFSSNKPEEMRRFLSNNRIDHEEGAGCYKGQREPVWAVHTDTFWDIFCAECTISALVADQESILQVTSCKKQYAQLMYLSDWRTEYLGSMHKIPDHVATDEDAWTWMPSSRSFWVARRDNPDRVPPPAGWQTEQNSAKHSRWVHTLGIACREFETSVSMEKDLHEVREHIKQHFGVK